MSHPVDVFVGKKLRLRRKLLGLSQDAVASAVGVTFQQVQKYERGVNRISASRLAEFAQALKVPIVYFFEGLTNSDEYQVAGGEHFSLAENKNSYDMDMLNNSETIELLKYFHQCSPSMRRSFIEMIKAMASDKPVANM